MAGLEFDRQAFVPTKNTVQGRSIIHLISPLLLVLALASVGYVGYKVYLVNLNNSAVASANQEIQRLQQELSETQKRLDTVERRHKSVASEPVSNPDASAKPPKTQAPVRTVYRIAAASVQPASTNHDNSPSSTPATRSTELEGQITANHEAWQATTNRLTDVVGVVGTQQGEISETREAVNQLLAQTQRRAVSFELDKTNNRVPAGPVTLQFKSADAKTQRYTVCIFFNSEKCIELKDRALNEVVVFIVAKNTAPLELVATRIQHGQIAGYVAVPTSIQ